MLSFQAPGRVAQRSKGYRLTTTNPKFFRNPNKKGAPSRITQTRATTPRAREAERERDTNKKKCCVNASSDRSKTPSLHHHPLHLHYLLLLDNNNSSLAKLLAKDRTPVPVLPGVTSPKARKRTRTDTCSGKPRRKKAVDAFERAGNCRIF